jgi:hypothetical protein
LSGNSLIYEQTDEDENGGENEIEKATRKSEIFSEFELMKK